MADLQMLLEGIERMERLVAAMQRYRAEAADHIRNALQAVRGEIELGDKSLLLASLNERLTRALEVLGG